MAAARRRGRPVSNIDREEVTRLLGIGFSWKKIAELIGVSSSKLKKWKTENEVVMYSNTTDEDLDRAVRNILNDAPNSGERMIAGALLAIGIKVKRDRMRASMTRVNPERRSMARRIRRRVYNVPFPNALW